MGVVGWLFAVALIAAIRGPRSLHYVWLGTQNNLSMRHISTHLRVFRNVGLVLIAVITVILMAMSVRLRTLGVSLFASAGWRAW